MKANELRIGNLVQYGVRDVPVKSIHIESVLKKEVSIYVELNEKLNHYCVLIHDVSPVPLAEDWLLKFGFKKKDSEWYLNPTFEIQIFVYCNNGKPDGVMFYTQSAHNDFVPIYINNPIKYVHQLQNLYFALTGEELTEGGDK